MGCGGEPYCGDGEVNVTGELCDDGNDDETDACLSSCKPRLISKLTVSWSFNEDETKDFSGDSCTDMGARTLKVSIDGPITDSKSETCSFRQVVFSDLPAGGYDVTVEPLDSSEALLTSAPVTTSIDYSGQDQDLAVVVTPSAWTSDYVGNYFFRVQWDAMECAAAGVAKQVTTLSREGVPLATVTQEGVSVNGGESPCDSELQSVLDLPWGEAEMHIQGLDATDTVIYDGTFDSFVGAGINNPDITFDVLPVP